MLFGLRNLLRICDVRCFFLGALVGALAGPVISKIFGGSDSSSSSDGGSSAGSTAGSIAGGLIDAGANYFLGEHSAQTQLEHQKELYGSRYQMQVSDMRKAGLNPALSYTTGAGSAGSASAPDYGKVDMSSKVTQGFQRLLLEQQAKKTFAEVDAVSAAADNTRTNTLKTQTEIDIMRQNNPYIQQNYLAQIDLALSNAEKVRAETVEIPRTSAANRYNLYASADYGNPLKFISNVLSDLGFSMSDTGAGSAGSSMSEAGVSSWFSENKGKLLAGLGVVLAFTPAGRIAGSSLKLLGRPVGWIWSKMPPSLKKEAASAAVVAREKLAQKLSIDSKMLQNINMNTIQNLLRKR